MGTAIRCHNTKPCQYNHPHPLGDNYGGTCKDEQFGNYCMYATNAPMERDDKLESKTKSVEGEVRKYLNFLKSEGVILVADENMVENIMKFINGLGFSDEAKLKLCEEVYGLVQRWLKYGG